MTFPYTANNQTFSYSASGGSAVSFSLTHVDYDHVYKQIWDQIATILESTANTEIQISNILDNTATIQEDTANVMIEIKNTIGLLVNNIEAIKTDIIQIQEDIASLEERGKSDTLGIVKRGTYWTSDCTRENDRFRQMMIISTIENLKECGLYDDLIAEIESPSEV